MPILLAKRSLDQSPTTRSTPSVVAERTESGRVHAGCQQAHKRENEGVLDFDFEPRSLAKKLKIQDTSAPLTIEKQWMACKDVGSDCADLIEHRWKASRAICQSNVAHRGAVLAKVNLLQCEKKLCEKMVQQSQAALEAKKEEFQDILVVDSEATASLMASLAEVQVAKSEWTEWNEPLTKSESADSDFVELLEHRWNSSKASCQSNVAHRAAVLAKVNLVQHEKVLCEKLVQEAQASLKAKEQELLAALMEDTKATTALNCSLSQVQIMNEEWNRWNKAFGGGKAESKED